MRENDHPTPPLHIVLIHPMIAGNTGNIIRLCANLGGVLHLVEPLGFEMEDSKLKRAGLDYHELTRVHVHPDWSTCAHYLHEHGIPSSRWFAYSAHGRQRYDQVSYTLPVALLFGAERTGLPIEVLRDMPVEQCLVLPMVTGSRSLNLSNAVAAVAYEAWRQNDFWGASTHTDAPYPQETLTVDPPSGIDSATGIANPGSP